VAMAVLVAAVVTSKVMAEQEQQDKAIMVVVALPAMPTVETTKVAVVVKEVLVLHGRQATDLQVLLVVLLWYMLRVVLAVAVVALAFKPQQILDKGVGVVQLLLIQLVVLVLLLLNIHCKEI
jgi:hypothetical protein